MRAAFLGVVLLALFCPTPFGYAQVNTYEPIGPWGGDRYQVYIDPGDPQTLYVVGFGIHKSTDGGEHWYPLQNTDTPSGGLLAFSLAFDPRDSSILYLGTMNGVWKSTNGGQLWRLASQGIADADCQIRSVIVDKNQPDTLYAGISRVSAYQSLIASAGRRDISAAIYKSTDAGQTWVPFDSGLPRPFADVTAVYQNPHNGELFAAPYGAGIYRYDPGQARWVASSQGLSEPLGFGVTSLAFDPVQGSTMFATTKKDWLYRSEDGGRTWVHVAYPETLEAPYPPMALFVTVDPNNPSRVWASAFAGMNRPRETAFFWADEDQSSGGLYQSRDGGRNWSRVQWNDLYPDSGPYSITFDPKETVGTPPNQTTKTSYVASVSIAGVLKSTDGGATYERKIQGINGMAATSFTQHPQDPNKLFATTEGVLHFSFDGGATWSRFVPVTQQGLIWLWDTAADPDDPDVLYYATGEPAWAWKDNKGLYKVRISSLNPTQELNQTGPGERVPGTRGKGIWKVYPVGGGTLYLATQDSGVLKSVDQGQTWTQVNTGLEQSSVTCLVFDSERAPRFAGTRASSGEAGSSLWNPGESGGLYRWDAGSNGWQRIGASLINDAVYKIVVLPEDPQKVFVATREGIFFSPDGGQSWEPRQQGLPESTDFLSSDLVAGFSSSQRVLVASSWVWGVYVSPDLGMHWIPYRNGLAPWIVQHVWLDPQREGLLYAATLGGSVFRCRMGHSPTVESVTAGGIDLSPPYKARVQENEQLEIRIQASDADNDPLTATAYWNGQAVGRPGTENPANPVSFDPSTMTFTWTPPYGSSQYNPYRVDVVLSDGLFFTSVSIQVEVGTPPAPVFDTVSYNGTTLQSPYGFHVPEMVPIVIRFDAHDPLGGQLNYQATLAGQPVPPPDRVSYPPQVFSFDAATRTFCWIPAYGTARSDPYHLVLAATAEGTWNSIDIEIFVDHAQPTYAPEVSLGLNGNAFTAGDTMTLTMGLSNFGAQVTGDLYLAIGVPEYPYYKTYPLAKSIRLPSFLDLEGITLLHVSIGSTWKKGPYLWTLILTRQGGNVKDQNAWLAWDSVDFTIK